MQDRLYEFFYGSRYSPEDWKYDCLVAHLQDILDNYKWKLKNIHEIYERDRMTLDELRQYYDIKVQLYEGYLKSIKLRKQREEK